MSFESSFMNAINDLWIIISIVSIAVAIWGIFKSKPIAAILGIICFCIGFISSFYVSIPDVHNYTYSEASSTLQAVGFRIETDIDTPTDDQLVVSQFPEGGATTSGNIPPSISNFWTLHRALVLRLQRFPPVRLNSILLVPLHRQKTQLSGILRVPILFSQMITPRPLVKSRFRMLLAFPSTKQPRHCVPPVSLPLQILTFWIQLMTRKPLACITMLAPKMLRQAALCLVAQRSI